MQSDQDIIYLLRKRAEIRLANKDRKSVQEGKPDRAAQLMLDAADEIEKLREQNERYRAKWAYGSGKGTLDG